MINFLNEKTKACNTADTLCQLNEYLKDAGCDVPAFVEAKTGIELPTSLPTVAQDSLQWINDNVGINPVNASIGIAAVSSVVGMYSTYKLAQAIFRDCPTDVYNAIKDNHAHMEYYRQLSVPVVAALSQMDTAATKQWFDATNNVNSKNGKTARELFSAMTEDKQVQVVKALVEKQPGKKFNDKTQAKRVKEARALEAAKSVNTIGVQKDATVSDAAADVQPGLLGKIYNAACQVVSHPIANTTYLYENYCPTFSNYVPAFLSKKPANVTTTNDNTNTAESTVVTTPVVDSKASLTK